MVINKYQYYDAFFKLMQYEDHGLDLEHFLYISVNINAAISVQIIINKEIPLS